MNVLKERRAREIFDLALDTPPPERRALVEREAAGDPEVIEKVSTLLASEESGGATEKVRKKAPPLTTPGATDLGWVREYHLIQVLGEGGYGVVYHAQRAGEYREDVALKVLIPGRDSRETIARFRQEMQALAVMKHDHIARILDGDVSEAGSALGPNRPFFVMELVRGKPITKYCDEKGLGIRARLELFALVCDAAQHAHTKRVIHRDLKPSNILVETRDGRAVPKVIDFGVAKAMDNTLAPEQIASLTEDVFGTPEYMSPEQAGGADIDNRADVYGLGAILYELLIGVPPMDPYELRAMPRQQMLKRIREEARPSPSRRFAGIPESSAVNGAAGTSTASGAPFPEPKPKLHEATTDPRASDDAEQNPAAAYERPTRAAIAAARATTPHDLERILRKDLEWIPQKATDLDRDRRYETAKELADDVRRYLAHEAIKARPASVGYRFRKWVRRNRVQVAMGALVVAALTALSASAAYSQWQRIKADGVVSKSLVAAEEVTGLIVGVFLKESDPESGAIDETALQNLKLATEAADAAIRYFPQREARFRYQMGQAYLAVGHPDAAVEQLRRARELWNVGPDRSPELSTRAGRWLGEALCRAGAESASSAIPLLESVVDEMQSLPGCGKEELLEAKLQLAMAHKSAGHFDLAERQYAHILTERMKLLGPDDPDTILVRFDQALSTLARGKIATDEKRPDAPQMFQSALSQMKTVASEFHRVRGEFYKWTISADAEVAALESRLDRYDDAKSSFEAVRPRLALLGTTNFRVAESLANYGKLLMKQRNYSAAEPLLMESLETYRASKTRRSWKNTITVGQWLAECRNALGNAAGAIEVLEQGFNDMKHDGVESSRLAEQARRIAKLCSEQGNEAEAQKWFQLAGG